MPPFTDFAIGPSPARSALPSPSKSGPIAITVLCLAFVLAGCGSSDELRRPEPDTPSAPSDRPTTGDVAGVDSLRILLLGDRFPTEVSIEAAESELEIHAGPETRTVPAEESVRVTTADDHVRIRAGSYTLRTDRARFRAGADGSLRVHTGEVARRYSGTLSIEVDTEESGLRLVNRVDLESYVASVVASEYPFDQIEGLKAQAVIARTYALRVQHRNADRPYDLTDYTASQAYRGLDDVTDRALEAARATAGQILTHRGSPIEAVYSASSGGHTADNETVWATDPVAYLRGKPDAYDEDTPHQNWTFSMRAEALHEVLSEEFDFTVRSVEFLDRGESGRYGRVRVSGSRTRTVTANEVRLAVIRRYGPRSLKSTRFEVDRQSGEYEFTGSGYGHGVGLTQWGARNRAESGQSYGEILRFYYTDVRLEHVPPPAEEDDADLPALASVTTSSDGESSASSGAANGPEASTPAATSPDETDSSSDRGSTEASSGRTGTAEDGRSRRPGW